MTLFIVIIHNDNSFNKLTQNMNYISSKKISPR